MVQYLITQLLQTSKDSATQWHLTYCKVNVVLSHITYFCVYHPLPITFVIILCCKTHAHISIKLFSNS